MLTKFRTYQNSEVKALFHRGQSEWSIFDGRKNANFTPLGRSKGCTATLSQAEKDELKFLRGWTEEFYGSNSSKNLVL